MIDENEIYSPENLEVKLSNGTYITSLNSMLVRKQKLIGLEIELLKISHITRYYLFGMMELTEDPELLRQYAAKFEELEYLQQTLWRFEPNKDYHRWYDVPKCTCPKQDNDDLFGCKQRIIDLKCIIHGGKRDVSVR